MEIKSNVLFFILGLIISLPMAVAGNLITPPFRRWCETRTAAGRRKRLEKMKLELADAERTWTYTQAEVALAAQTMAVGSVVIACLYSLLSAALLLLYGLDHAGVLSSLARPFIYVVYFTLIIGMAMNFFNGIRILNTTRKGFKLHSEYEQQNMRDEIARLSAKCE